jgi:Uma2 family endonuclease
MSSVVLEQEKREQAGLSTATDWVVRKRLFTAEEYHAMAKAGILMPDERVELINGEIIEMSPVGSLHFNCVNRLNMLLAPLLAGKAIVSVQNPIRLNDETEPEPDVVILKKKAYESAPTPEDVLLLIEVADSTFRHDREVKIPAYAAAGVAESWIVNVSKDQVIVYTNLKDGEYQSMQIVEGEASIKATQLEVVELTLTQILIDEWST